MVEKLISGKENEAQIRAFMEKVRNQSELDRTATDVEKEGIFTGEYAVNPFTGERVPIWIANYVLYEYGTGAVMGVPTHDERDWAFANKYNLQKKIVVVPEGKTLVLDEMTNAYTEDGVLVDSGEFTGMTVEKAKVAILDWLEKNNIGKRRVKTNCSVIINFANVFKLNHWLISSCHLI